MARRLAVLWIAAALSVPGVALAQDDPADGQDAPAAGDGYVEDDPPELKQLPDPGATQLGVGVRLRNVFMPRSMLELFLGFAPSGVSSTGIGMQVVRRKGNFDITAGFEYANIAPDDGLYLEKGDDPSIPGQYPDDVTFDGLALFGVDISFLWHQPITDKLAFRYGAGIGLGFVLGEITQFDTRCPPGTTVDDLDDRTHCGRTGPYEVNEDIPPVVPIVNVLVGARFNVVEKLSLDLDVGFRDLFYVGIGSTYFF